MKQIFIHLLFLYVSFANAQNTNPTGTFDPPNFVNLTQKEGLSGKNATAFAQDKQGFIWIGTNEGLTRYDGQFCKNFTHRQEDTTSLAANYVNALAAQEDGALWIASIGGLDLYFPDKQYFKHYKNNIKGTYAKCLLIENQDWTWVGSMNRDNYGGGGLQLLNKHTGECGYWKITDFLQKTDLNLPFAFKYNSVTALAKDPKKPNLLWVGVEAGVALFDISQFKFIQFWKFPNINLAEYQYVTSILPDNNGTVWVGAWTLGLYQLNPKESKWKYLDIKPDIKDPYRIVASIAEKSASEIFIGSGYGVLILDKKTQKFTLWEHDYRDAESIVGYLTWAIFKDKNDITWFGMGGGASRLDERQNLARFFYPNPYQKLNPNIFNVTGIGEDNKHHRFFATLDAGENLYIIDYQNNTHKNINYFKWKDKQNEPRCFQAASSDSKGNLWLYSQGELFVLKSGSEKIEPYSIFDSHFKKEKSPAIKQIHEDSKGNLWLVGLEDIFKLNINNQSITYFNIKKYILPNIKPNDFITDIKTDKNDKAYLATTAGVVVINDVSMSQILPFEQEKEEGLNFIRSLAITEDGAIWMNIANQGLIKCYLKNDKFILEKTPSGKTFFIADNIFQLEYLDGKFWTVNNEGIIYFDTQTLDNQYFGSNHGLRNRTTPAIGTNHLFAKMPSGKIVFASEAGKLGVFNPSQFSQKKDPEPRLCFSDFKVFDKSLKTTEHIDFQQDIYLSYKENFFSVAFAALHFSNHQDLRYAYRLDGIDADWVTTNTPNANYTNLKGGNYIFNIKAINRDGVWSKTRTLNVHIEPPFWEKTAFRILAFLILITSIYAFYRYRIKEIKEKNRMEQIALQSEIKALQAQMNPHFMFNTLNTIKSSVLNEKPFVAAEYLSDFAYLLRQTLEQSREKNISLQDDLESLLLYIRLEMLRFGEKFDFEYVLNPNVPTTEAIIPPMILQPYVENAIRHAFNHQKEKGLLQLNVSMESENIVLCVIEDNGLGRKNKSSSMITLEQSVAKNKHQSLGMKITEERILLHNQLNYNTIHINIIDKKNTHNQASGTRVEVRLQLIVD